VKANSAARIISVVLNNRFMNLCSHDERFNQYHHFLDFNKGSGSKKPPSGATGITKTKKD
jgi:hypothetical protein